VLPDTLYAFQVFAHFSPPPKLELTVTAHFSITAYRQLGHFRTDFHHHRISLLSQFSSGTQKLRHRGVPHPKKGPKKRRERFSIFHTCPYII
jgi:hypothetical protein